MVNVFVISDLHLGHSNILKFMHNDKPLRPFQDLNEMHTTIMDNWKRVVAPQDKVYVLGDVAFKLEAMHMFDYLPGHKRLVLGNHDKFDIGVYAKYFEKIFGVTQINGVWLTHVPMHECSAGQDRVKKNIHGHLHANKIARADGSPHPKYFNASVECINYTPISIEEVLSGI
jgi:calcineurin-like phosphoesterase family protein